MVKIDKTVNFVNIDYWGNKGAMGNMVYRVNMVKMGNKVDKVNMAALLNMAILSVYIDNKSNIGQMVKLVNLNTTSMVIIVTT